ncbi:MAG TPA: hypothetical protein VGO31_10485 [Microbacteriaceae bacterium]|jgi:hypothetical protein|nr:hypothetical protein [Microbacteriaceae bacterium]
MTFWLALFGIVSSFLGALIALALRIDTTTIEGGFIGAFLGSFPIILLPTLARFAHGSRTRLARRDDIWFRLTTIGWGVLIAGSRLIWHWPHTAPASSTLALAGLVAAIFASWYWPHLPAALRIWVRRQHPLIDDAARHRATLDCTRPSSANRRDEVPSG